MTTLAQISSSQAQKEVVANEDLAAVAPAGLFARKYTTTTGLTWGYYGGILPGTFAVIADGTVLLTNATTNYIEADAAGTVTANTVGFTAGRQPLYSAVCAGGVITSYVDYRTAVMMDAATVLSPAVLSATPKWYKVGNGLLYSAFSIAGTQKSNTLFSLIAGGLIHGFKVKHSTLFTGAGIATVTASIGILGDLQKYSTAFDVKQAVPAIPWITQIWGVESDAGATDIKVTLDSTGANLDQLSQGVLDVSAMLSRAI